MLELLRSNSALSLREILPGAHFVGATDIRVSGCSADSRQCKPGDTFVAIRGTQHDGHDFIDQAIARGAAAVVVQHEVQASVPTCVVPDTRHAFGQMCHALAGQPSHALRVIGVTGTNGKTTTTRLIGSVLAAAGYRVGTLGTLGYCDSVDTGPAELTTPGAGCLAGWMARMRAADCSHAVMEVSSHAIDQRRIAGIEFSCVALTNLRRDHLDYHQNIANYHRAKIELFEYVGRRGTAVINVDDPASLENAPLMPGRVLTVAMRTGADLTATMVERFKSEQTFFLNAGNRTLPVRTAMIGDHHVYNCLTAAAIGLAEGIDLTTIVEGLEAVRSVPGRLERIECGQPFGVFVDYAHTPDALLAALEALREVTPGRLICVFGAGGNRDVRKRPLMGRAVEANADVAVITNDNPRLEDPRAIARDITGGLNNPAHARWIEDRRQAIEYALSLAQPDDCVLIAGRGHEAFQQIGGDRIPLDDRDVARRYLYNLAPASSFGALASVCNS
jgi:UDP-N-acetylmuramoyl-L-alanyl-D-glutamate--2,6-diaminopimelate ligase